MGDFSTLHSVTDRSGSKNDQYNLKDLNCPVKKFDATKTHSTTKEHTFYSSISWTFKPDHAIQQNKSQLISKKSVSHRNFSCENSTIILDT